MRFLDYFCFSHFLAICDNTRLIAETTLKFINNIFGFRALVTEGIVKTCLTFKSNLLFATIYSLYPLILLVVWF